MSSEAEGPPAPEEEASLRPRLPLYPLPEYTNPESRRLAEKVAVLSLELRRISDEMEALYADLEDSSLSRSFLERRVLVVRPLAFLRKVLRKLRERAQRRDLGRRLRGPT